MACLADAANQLLEIRHVDVVEHTLFGSNTENNFWIAVELARAGRHACARELQPVTAERKFCWRYNSYVRFRHETAH
jgi:hypothetical protein